MMCENASRVGYACDYVRRRSDLWIPRFVQRRDPLPILDPGKFRRFLLPQEEDPRFSVLSAFKERFNLPVLHC